MNRKIGVVIGVMMVFIIISIYQSWMIDTLKSENKSLFDIAGQAFKLSNENDSIRLLQINEYKEIIKLQDEKILNLINKK